MKTLLIATLALPLALATVAGPGFANSRTEDSTSKRMAATRSMTGVPTDASMRNTRCEVVRGATHFRCTTTWEE